jgi:hypothetical protein
MVDVQWKVDAADKSPDHCARGKTKKGSPFAPINWWQDDEFGVPYKWNGSDDAENFLLKHDKDKKNAGLHDSTDPTDQKCTTGIDCSGLASLAWGVQKCAMPNGKELSEKRSTRDNSESSLLVFAEQRDEISDANNVIVNDWFKHVQPGDLLVVPSHESKSKEDPKLDGHVVIVSDVNSKGGKACIYEASGHKKVLENSTGKDTWLEWTAQPREIDRNFFHNDEPGRHWYVWRWCGNPPVATSVQPYNCTAKLQFPDKYYSIGKPKAKQRAKSGPRVVPGN